MRNRVLSAYATSLLGIASGLLTNLWLLRKIVHAVPSSEFGVYAFVIQLTAYLSLLQLGLDFSASRSIAEALGRGDNRSANAAYWEVARFNRRGAGVAAIVVILLSAILWFGVRPPGTSPRLVSGLAILAGAQQVLSFYTRRYTAALVGTNKQSYVNLTAVVSTISSTLLAYVLLRGGAGIACIPAANLVIAFISLVALAIIARRHCQWITTRPVRDPVMLKSIVGYGWRTAVGSLAWTVEATCDVVILERWGGTQAVALYVLWWRFPTMIFDICVRLASSAFPSFAERHGRSRAEAANALESVGQVTIGLATLALIGISIWLPGFVQIWIGERFSFPDERTVALGMGVLVALRAFGNLLGMFWMSSGNAGGPMILSIAQAFLKLGLAIVWVTTWGITGTVAASCAASALQVIGTGVALWKQGTLAMRIVRNAIVLVGLAFVISTTTILYTQKTSIGWFVIGTSLTVLLWSAVWGVSVWYSALRPYAMRILKVRI